MVRLAMVRQRGFLEEEYLDGLASVQSEAIQKPLCLAEPPEEDSKKLVAFLEGFSLQAGARIHERDRQGLEHLLRCALRPPLSLEGLSRASDGRVVASLRRPLLDGATAVAFMPTQLLERLAALVPAPKRHTARYFGVLAPSGVRTKVIRGPALRRRRGCEAVQEHCDWPNDEAVRAALRDELGFGPLALGPPPDLEYDLDDAARTLDRAPLERRESWMWRYRELLPMDELAELPSLQTGMTPIYGAPQLARKLGAAGLWIKDEGRSPTRSVWDRAALLCALMALERGRKVLAAAGDGPAVGARLAGRGLHPLRGGPRGGLLRRIFCWTLNSRGDPQSKRIALFDNFGSLIPKKRPRRPKARRPKITGYTLFARYG